MSQIIFGSVCSGIEAASAAWYPLGWRAAWLAEIDPFASKVLAHHHPTVPNLGDMTLIAAKVRTRLVAAPDVLVGGTPCQAYSVAGLRESLDDPRGQLTLSFVGLANAIDDTRADDGEEPCIIVWENVPGVLNTKDNAFGCFLGGLAGEDDALVAPGGKWPNAGVVYGPQRTVAWRVLDAQYFGVAQRRRRVFVIASAREGFDPGEVLFEFDGMRRDTAPRREPGQETAGTLASRATGGGFPGTDEAAAGYVQPVGGLQRPGVDLRNGVITGEIAHTLGAGHHAPDPASTPHVLAFGGNNQSGPIDLATARNACSSSSGRLDFESETFLVQAGPIAFDSRQSPVSSTQLFGALGSSSPQAQAVCIHSDAIGRTGEALTPGPDSEGRVRLRNPGMGLLEDGTTYNLMATSQPHAVCITGDITHCLKADGFDASEDGTGRGQPIVAAVALRGRDGGATAELGDDIGFTLRAGGGGDKPHAMVDMAVRRLTPRECERLQAFPDNHTSIPVKKVKRRSKMFDYTNIDGELWQLAADGPRYKALGNSMCVYNMRWLGERIDLHLTNPYGDLI